MIAQIDAATDNKILELARSGWPQKSIADELGCCQASVSGHLCKMGWSQSNRTEEMLRLYRSGLSVAKVAQQIGKSRNNVLQCLRNHNALRQNFGITVEYVVGHWLTKQGKNVQYMPKGHPFDILVDGERIDVKWAKLARDNSFHFALVNRSSRTSDKDYSSCFDSFYFVCASAPIYSVYRLAARHIPKEQSTLKLPKSLRTIYPVEFIGRLNSSSCDSGGGEDI